MVNFLAALTGLAFVSFAFGASDTASHTPSEPKNSFIDQKGNTCRVIGKGAGQDDGPTILEAFSRCGTNGKVILDGYYVILLSSSIYVFSN